MGKLIFVTGGARSGKSRFAEEILSGREDVLYIATAVPFDDEMKERIRLHRERRDPRWRTAEGYCGLGSIIRSHARERGSLLLDCVTVMVTNLMLEKGDIDWDTISQIDIASMTKRVEDEVEELLDALSFVRGVAVVVSNEVGMGIVPANPLSRLFRDIAGRANQRIAGAADEVYLTVSGIPLKIKGER